MIDDFFQQKPPLSQRRNTQQPWHSIFRGLLYTSGLGFFMGLAFGYLYLKGWVPTAEDGLILYGVTFGIGAILATYFVVYKQRNQLKAKPIRTNPPRR